MTKDFLAITDCSADEIRELFALAAKMKAAQKRGEPMQPLKGQTLALIFQKPSTRTRVSFEVGMNQLGGHALYLAPEGIGLGTRESIPDVARVLSRYVDGIMARVFAHSDIVELAEWASVPVVNGLSDLLHPCQVLGDMLTINEHFGRFTEVHVAYVGDGNNVCNSWLNYASRMPIKLSIGVPEGFEPDADILQHAQNTGLSEITVHHAPEGAVSGAEVIYTDVWASMGQEAEAAGREARFRPFQVNEQLFTHAAPGAKFMHCLPAHRGDEVTDEIMDGPRSIVFDQAENRLHIQKAILVELMASRRAGTDG